MKSPSTLNSSFPQSIASQPKKSVQQAPPEALASKVRKGNVAGGEHKGKEDYKVIWVHQVGMENRGWLDLSDQKEWKGTGESKARKACQDRPVDPESQYLPQKSRHHLLNRLEMKEEMQRFTARFLGTHVLKSNGDSRVRSLSLDQNTWLKIGNWQLNV